MFKEFALNTYFGSALNLLAQRIGVEMKDSEIYRTKDYRPVIFLIIYSEPTDKWKEELEKIKKLKFTSMVALITNTGFDTSFLNEITKDVLKLISKEDLNQTFNICFRKLMDFVLTSYDKISEDDEKYFWIRAFWNFKDIPLNRG